MNYINCRKCGQKNMTANKSCIYCGAQLMNDNVRKILSFFQSHPLFCCIISFHIGNLLFVYEFPIYYEVILSFFGVFLANFSYKKNKRITKLLIILNIVVLFC